MSSPDTIEATSLAKLVDECPDAVVIVDADAVVRYANAAVSTVLGYQPGDLVGRRYDVLIPDDVRSAHDRHHATFLEHPVSRPMGRGLLLRARNADGFDVDVTIALVPIDGPEPMAAAIVREVTSAQLMIDRLAATNELLTAALGGASRREVEQRTVELVGDLLDCGSSWLLSSDDAGRPTEIIAAGGSGDGMPTVDGVEALPVERNDVMWCPITSAGATMVLLVRRPDALRDFGELDHRVLCEFANAFAITVELIEARREVEYLRSIADHDRIARDLHDRVIQRLFAIAMRLESVASQASGPERERIGEAVDSLDSVIREIRTTIFDLRRGTGPTSLRISVATEIDEAAIAMGFAPSLRFIGSMDDTVGEALREEAPIVVRELLANVARHSQARTVDVTVYTDDRRFRIVVDDDGIGMTDAPGSGDGLRNLRERAHAHSGTFEVTARQPTGTTAEWSAPVEA